MHGIKEFACGAIALVAVIGLKASRPADASQTLPPPRVSAPAPLPSPNPTPQGDCIQESCTVKADCAWANGQWACYCCGSCSGSGCISRSVCRSTGGAAPACGG